MNDSLRTRINKTKQFVSNHKTFVACAVTAAVTAKVTRDQTMKTVSYFLYEKGYEAGTLGMLLDEAYNFIKKQGLEEEFVKFANMTEVSP